jgi:hypothetical protein
VRLWLPRLWFGDGGAGGGGGVAGALVATLSMVSVEYPRLG